MTATFSERNKKERSGGVILLFALAYFVIALAFNCLWFGFKSDTRSYPLLCTLNFMPAVVLGAFGVCVRRRKVCVSSRSVVLLCLAGLGALVVTNGMAARDFRLVHNIDLEDYVMYIGRDSEFRYAPSYRSYLPCSIPPEATKVRFFRGTTIDLNLLQLRMVLPEARVQELIEEYTPKAVYSQRGAPRRNENSSCVLTQFRNSENSGFAPLPEQFLVLVLEVGLPSAVAPPKPENWQQNYSCGIAASVRTNEVIYWATYP